VGCEWGVGGVWVGYESRYECEWKCAILLDAGGIRVSGYKPRSLRMELYQYCQAEWSPATNMMVE